MQASAKTKCATASNVSCTRLFVLFLALPKSIICLLFSRAVSERKCFYFIKIKKTSHASVLRLMRIAHQCSLLKCTSCIVSEFKGQYAFAGLVRKLMCWRCTMSATRDSLIQIWIFSGPVHISLLFAELRNKVVCVICDGFIALSRVSEDVEVVY